MKKENFWKETKWPKAISLVLMIFKIMIVTYTIFSSESLTAMIGVWFVSRWFSSTYKNHVSSIDKLGDHTVKKLPSQPPKCLALQVTQNVSGWTPCNFHK